LLECDFIKKVKINLKMGQKWGRNMKGLVKFFILKLKNKNYKIKKIKK